MKKLVLLFAVAAMTVSASAQSTVYGSKFTDNWSIGVQGGLATKTTQNRWLSNTNPFAGIRLGKDFTPAFGLVAEGNVYFNDRSGVTASDPDFFDGQQIVAGHVRGWRTKTFAKSLNVNLLAKVNLTNAIAGYTGEPRAFEVSALYGFGWLHGYGMRQSFLVQTAAQCPRNTPYKRRRSGLLSRCYMPGLHGEGCRRDHL